MEIVKQSIRMIDFESDPEPECRIIIGNKHIIKELDFYILDHINNVLKNKLLHIPMNSFDLSQLIHRYQTAIHLLRPVFPNVVFLFESIYHETRAMKKNKNYPMTDSISFLFDLCKYEFNHILFLIDNDWIEKGFLICHKLIRYMHHALTDVFTSDEQEQNILLWKKTIESDMDLSLSLSWIQWRNQF